MTSTNSTVLGLIGFGVPIIDWESPSPAQVAFPKDNLPRLRDGKARPETIARCGTRRTCHGHRGGSHHRERPDHLGCQWRSAIGYCTDQNYADIVVLVREPKSDSVMFAMPDIFQIIGVNTAEYLPISGQIGTLELGKLADIISLDGNPLGESSTC